MQKRAFKKTYKNHIASLILMTVIAGCVPPGAIWRNDVTAESDILALSLDTTEAGQILDAFRVGTEAYLRKLNPEGVEQWRADLGPVPFTSRMQIENYGEGAVALTTLTAPASLIKVGETGEVQWQVGLIEDGKNLSAEALAVDAAGNIHVSGNTFGGLAVEFVYDAAGTLLRKTVIETNNYSLINVFRLGEKGVLTEIWSRNSNEPMLTSVTLNDADGALIWSLNPAELGENYLGISVGQDNRILVFFKNEFVVLDENATVLNRIATEASWAKFDKKDNLFYVAGPTLTKLDKLGNVIFSEYIPFLDYFTTQPIRAYLDIKIDDEKDRVLILLSEMSHSLYQQTVYSEVAVLDGTTAKTLALYRGKPQKSPYCTPTSCLHDERLYQSGDWFNDMELIGNGKFIVNGNTTESSVPDTGFVAAYKMP